MTDSELLALPEAPRFVPVTHALASGFTGRVTRVQGSNPNESEPVVGTVGILYDEWSPQHPWAHDVLISRTVYWPALRKAGVWPNEDLGLDPMGEGVQDHLARRLGLLPWLRAGSAALFSGAPLASWEVGAMVACAASGSYPVGIEARFRPSSPKQSRGTYAGQNYRWACGYIDGKHDWKECGYACRRCANCHAERPGPGDLYLDLWKRGSRGDRPFIAFDSTCPGAVLDDHRRGMGWLWGRDGGPETGEAATARLHALALNAGFALRFDADTLILPWKGGPRRWVRT